MDLLKPKTREAIKKAYLKIVGDPVALRVALASMIFVVGILVVEMPFASGLEATRGEHDLWSEYAEAAEKVSSLQVEAARYKDYVDAGSDLVEWGEYILAHLKQSGAKLLEFRPVDVTSGSVFDLLVIEIMATGTYPQIIEFVRRLEVGDRFIRVDRITLEAVNGELQLRMTLNGLSQLVLEEPSADGEMTPDDEGVLLDEDGLPYGDAQGSGDSDEETP